MSTLAQPPQAQQPAVENVIDEKKAPAVAEVPAAPAAQSSSASTSSQGATKEAATAEPSGPVKEPFPFPLDNCKPPSPPELTPEQEAKYATLLATVSSWTEIPNTSARNSATSPITDEERMWLTRECLLRYLRATKWSSTEAPKRLLSTLTWRREYGLKTFTAEYISPENETGKQFIQGFDNEGRPCLFLNPSKQNTPRSERQIQHLVYNLERVIDLMGPGQESLALVINFKDSSAGSNASVGQGRQVLTILQNHYPERLGKALISELPWYVTTFFRIISPFIDPVTKTKMKFNEPFTLFVPPSQLPRRYGGELDFVYDHAVYWPALHKLCDKRQQEYRERWERAGKKVGEFEAYLRGGEHKSLAETMAEAEKGSEAAV